MRRLRLDSDALQWRTFEGEVLAIDLANSQYLNVNRSGALLWPLLAEGTTDEELLDALGRRWKLPPDQARADVESFLAWLDGRGLLVEDTS